MVTVPPESLVIGVRRYAMFDEPVVSRVPPDATVMPLLPVSIANPELLGARLRSPLLATSLVVPEARVNSTLVPDPSTMRVWVPVAPPPTWRELMLTLLVRSTE